MIRDNVMVGATTRRGAAAARTVNNLLEVARFGGLRTDDEPTPYEVVTRTQVFRLRHYGVDAAETTSTATGTKRPVALLVPPLMLTADVYDVSSTASAVSSLVEAGVDTWVVDFGAPEREAKGMKRNLADHVLAISDAVDNVRERVGADIHLMGYSQGGMFCYQTAAYRLNDGIASITVFGSPVDLRSGAPLNLPPAITVNTARALRGGLVRKYGVPGWMTRTGFQMLDPIGTARSRIEFLLQLHDRDALLPREGQRRYLMQDGWIAWPGPALSEFLEQFVVSNRMLAGGFTIGDRPVTLADIDVPILTFVGEIDSIAPPAAVRAIERAAPQAEVHEVALRTGHFGLVVGRTAMRTTWPLAAAWTHAIQDKTPLPDDIVRVDHDHDHAHGAETDPAFQIGYRANLALRAAGGLSRTAVRAATGSVGTLQGLATGPVAQVPRIRRLGNMHPRTRVSIGMLLEEHADRHPDRAALLFGNRAYTYAEVNERIDAITRGLISLGVRRGESVGVLMDSRPSAIGLTAALNRLGAIAVLMRPGVDSMREAQLGKVSRVFVDPAHASIDLGTIPVEVFLLPRDFQSEDVPDEVTDLEQLGTAVTELPSWFERNPGRAEDVAFVMFAGVGDGLHSNEITNGHFALAAIGAATAAELDEEDTVYGVGALHHPSGLLTLVGASIAGGARMAMASSTDSATFWEEVRRYGVTVVSYTWAQLHDISYAEPQPGERHHQVRLFMGSGLPRGLWRRVLERFEPAKVLEFWASAEADAVLANVSGAKIGAAGRPVPGSVPLRLAQYDTATARLITGEDGFAVPCEDEQVGMLLAAVPKGKRVRPGQVRDVFAPGDAWVPTGSLFRRDADGDYWLIDRVDEALETTHGDVPRRPMADAIGDLPAVSLAAAYARKQRGEVVAAVALTLHGNRTLNASDLDVAVAHLPQAHRPAYVHVIDKMPLTSWSRPDSFALANAKPAAAAAGTAWKLDARTGRYVAQQSGASKR